MKHILLVIAIGLFSCSDAQIYPAKVAVSNKSFNQDYSLESQAVFALMTTQPTTAEKIIWNDFINRQVANGNWRRLQVFQLRAAENADNGLRDWKGNAHGTNNGATHSPGVGYTYDGVSQYINTGFTPSTGGGTLYTQNDAGMGVVAININNPAQVGYMFGSFDSGNRRVGIVQNAGTSVQHFINCVNPISYTDDTRLYKGTYTTIRIGASSQRLSANGNGLTTSSTSSNGLPTLPVYEGCRNLTGSANSFLNYTSAAFFVFRGSTFDQVEFHYDLVVMLMRLNQLHTAGLPSWATPLIHLVGQSNAVGVTTDTPSSSTLTDPITGVYIRVASFDVLDYPTNNQGANYGIELTLGYRLRSILGTDIYMYKEAYQGAPVHQEPGAGDFDFNFNSVGEYYDSWKTASDNNLNAVRLLDKIPLSILILIQGEADRGTQQYASDWWTNWQTNITGLKSVGVGFSFYIINKLNSGLTFDTSPTIVNTLRDAATLKCNSDPSRWLAYDMNRLGSLNALSYPHYRGTQYELGGNEIADLIVQQIIR